MCNALCSAAFDYGMDSGFYLIALFDLGQSL